MTGAADLLAHQGGWDEIGLFALPVLLALGAVWFVERRQRKNRTTAPDRETSLPDPDADFPDSSER